MFGRRVRDVHVNALNVTVYHQMPRCSYSVSRHKLCSITPLATIFGNHEEYNHPLRVSVSSVRMKPANYFLLPCNSVSFFHFCAIHPRASIRLQPSPRPLYIVFHSSHTASMWKMQYTLRSPSYRCDLINASNHSFERYLGNFDSSYPHSIACVPTHSLAKCWMFILNQFDYSACSFNNGNNSRICLNTFTSHLR